MFVRILLAMALAVMLFAGSGIDGFSIKSLRSSISDKETLTSPNSNKALPALETYGNTPNQ